MAINIKATNTYKVMNGVVITEVKGYETKEIMKENSFDAENLIELKEKLKDSITYDGDFLYLESADLFLVYKEEGSDRTFLEKIGFFCTHPDVEDMSIELNLE